MNKNDFYKQLMSEYTFDADKIRENAKKGRFARQKISPMAIGLTATVAAVTVACGTLALTMLGNRAGVDLVDTGKPRAELSAAERVRIAIEQQNQLQDSEEIIDVLVTFNTPIAPARAEDILSSYTDDSIPVKAVYLADGSKIVGSEQVASVFLGTQEIRAVAVRCAGSVMGELQSHPDVALAEDYNEADFDTLVPFDPADVETMEVIENALPPAVIPDTPEGTAPDTDIPDNSDGTLVIPETFESSESIESGEVIDYTEEPSETEESLETAETDAAFETTEPSLGTEEPSFTEEAPVTTEPAPDNPETAEPVAPEAPEVIVPQLPVGVTLPENPDRFVYETTELYDAENAFFLNDNVFFVMSSYDIALYHFNGIEEIYETSVECREGKIHWISENGGRLIVSGVGENGSRNKLWLVDANAYEIHDLHAEDTVMDGTLASVGYNAESGLLVMNVKENGVYYVCVSSLNGSAAEFIGTPFSSSAKTYLMGVNGKTLYLAVSDGALTQIYAVNVYTEEVRIIKTYDNNPGISKNLAFTHAVVSPSDTALTGNIEIFDPVSESFIRTEYFNESIVFGASRHSFGVSGSYFTVSGGAISPAGGIGVIAPIEYKKSFSQKYAAAASGGHVKITESIYSAENRAGMLTFGQLTPSGDSEFREAMDNAIGMNNALALLKCREAGITTQPLLLEALSVCYSENAVKQLKAQCHISDHGALDYTAGGLKPIRADETVLVISSAGGNTASGMLYIKAGSFGGRTAYRSISVSFVKEDGAWKSNSVLK